MSGEGPSNDVRTVNEYMEALGAPPQPTGGVITIDTSQFTPEQRADIERRWRIRERVRRAGGIRVNVSSPATHPRIQVVTEDGSYGLRVVLPPAFRARRDESRARVVGEGYARYKQLYAEGEAAADSVVRRLRQDERIRRLTAEGLLRKMTLSDDEKELIVRANPFQTAIIQQLNKWFVYYLRHRATRILSPFVEDAETNPIPLATRDDLIAIRIQELVEHINVQTLHQAVQYGLQIATFMGDDSAPTVMLQDDPSKRQVPEDEDDDDFMDELAQLYETGNQKARAVMSPEQEEEERRKKVRVTEGLYVKDQDEEVHQWAAVSGRKGVRQLPGPEPNQYVDETIREMSKLMTINLPQPVRHSWKLANGTVMSRTQVLLDTAYTLHDAILRTFGNEQFWEEVMHPVLGIPEWAATAEENPFTLKDYIHIGQIYGSIELGPNRKNVHAHLNVNIFHYTRMDFDHRLASAWITRAFHRSAMGVASGTLVKPGWLDINVVDTSSGEPLNAAELERRKSPDRRYISQPVRYNLLTKGAFRGAVFEWDTAVSGGSLTTVGPLNQDKFRRRKEAMVTIARMLGKMALDSGLARRGWGSHALSSSLLHPYPFVQLLTDSDIVQFVRRTADLPLMLRWINHEKSGSYARYFNAETADVTRVPELLVMVPRSIVGDWDHWVSAFKQRKNTMVVVDTRVVYTTWFRVLQLDVETLRGALINAINTMHWLEEATGEQVWSRWRAADSPLGYERLPSLPNELRRVEEIAADGLPVHKTKPAGFKRFSEQTRAVPKLLALDIRTLPTAASIARSKWHDLKHYVGFEQGVATGQAKDIVEMVYRRINDLKQIQASLMTAGQEQADLVEAQTLESHQSTDAAKG